jgi:hypothetical protein
MVLASILIRCDRVSSLGVEPFCRLKNSERNESLSVSRCCGAIRTCAYAAARAVHLCPVWLRVSFAKL